MPHLSKIRINPRRRDAIRLLGNPQAMHAAVLAGITEQPVTERVLWRLETADRHQPHLLVLTHSKPDWFHLVEQAGWPQGDGEHALVRDYSPLLDRIALGREFAFRLTANPVQTTRHPEKLTASQAERASQTVNGPSGEERPARGYRLAHRTAAHQLGWLLAKTPRLGFEIPAVRTNRAPHSDEPPAADVLLTARDQLRFRKGRSDRQVILSTATFEGRLRVTDPTALRAALLEGIGPAKSYGCGLLTLAPLPQERSHG
ncbi:type I-E CRISPR-associated protein Cas6/Cse3/CasE [Streptomyces sp. NPDC056549]|uniref:type I-E CRISPR-associated protein Cas6/Cse3/CasE n=1 Tax=Streptomyces sp. NPDC056549 TaxID=3345864 RepID=UPI00368198B1